MVRVLSFMTDDLSSISMMYILKEERTDSSKFLFDMRAKKHNIETLHTNQNKQHLQNINNKNEGPNLQAKD